ncbi:helix-turn-helix transcriptional regulator [Grimontia kaedaensis]|uniref:Helix-turn-helix transcriptional regulator n=1 Tax=Grimontia kaedaensis TaxID=2872157 RepID=A0ABY4WQ33_9GAMM|nr:helix-turn-helix transcriptional regulator [Grimontia kaedaensis]USH01696.1 helix-turn-helix transcriptional regulator [Grimontia kaedaensis]
METIIDIWTSNPTEKGTAYVVPDGCRDVIVTETEGVQQVHVSPLFDATIAVDIGPNAKMTGYRLAPGTCVDESQLMAAIGKDSHDLFDKIAAFSRRFSNVDEALFSLGERVGSVADIARSLGVSERTLQRHLLKHSGKSPLFWQQLARVRQSARAIAEGAPLIDTAFEFGYADQAHFSREIKRWFGVTPSELLVRKDLTVQLYMPGYDTQVV